jgi:hypothetical protein
MFFMLPWLGDKEKRLKLWSWILVSGYCKFLSIPTTIQLLTSVILSQSCVVTLKDFLLDSVISILLPNSILDHFGASSSVWNPDQKGTVISYSLS